MIRTLMGVKVRIVRNSVHGSSYRKIATTLSYCGSAAVSLYSAGRLVVRATEGGRTSTESIVITLTMLFGLWVFGPLLVGGVDDALDPSRLTMLPITRREMHRGMFAGAMIGPLPVASTITLIGATVAYGRGIRILGVVARRTRDVAADHRGVASAFGRARLCHTHPPRQGRRNAAGIARCCVVVSRYAVAPVPARGTETSHRPNSAMAPGRSDRGGDARTPTRSPGPTGRAHRRGRPVRRVPAPRLGNRNRSAARRHRIGAPLPQRQRAQRSVARAFVAAALDRTARLP